ncbi:MAG: PD-(D/E)XK nuclease family protein, partial [Mangrovimonas sp.]|nr:PD-(D/E)XK nuclease family protein [Mangrovimonas sp.]
KGFSPSSLTTYIRNPIDFYYQKLLGIKEHEEVEETIAYNTLGTIVHNTLEDFYLPFVGFYISVKDLESLLPQIDNVVSHHFKEVYKSGDISKGKNLIIFEVAKRYVYNFLKQEIKDLNNGHSIKILGIELNTNMFLEDPKLPLPIKISGKIDRLDLFDGVTRIIDYKTGKVDQSQVQVTLWEDIITDYTKYSKPFQLLLYALLLNYNKEIKLPVEAGIFSFKNLNSGLLKFSKKDPEHSRAPKDNTITQETLSAFQEQLILLLNEIYNPTFDFIEKEV